VSACRGVLREEHDEHRGGDHAEGEHEDEHKSGRPRPTPLAPDADQIFGFADPIIIRPSSELA
jgi:hypothetical protein